MSNKFLWLVFFPLTTLFLWLVLTIIYVAMEVVS